MNDETTIKAIINRSETTICEVIERYSKLLWSVAGAVLENIGSVEDIEDCVADTFIYLWENPEKFDPRRGRLKTWLCIIARSRAYDRCRQISKHPTMPLEDNELIYQLGFTDDIAETDTRRALIAAINALDEPDREILIRRYYYDQKPRQIALALDMSVKQVDNRLYRTKLKLRQAVEI